MSKTSRRKQKSEIFSFVAPRKKSPSRHFSFLIRRLEETFLGHAHFWRHTNLVLDRKNRENNAGNFFVPFQISSTNYWIKHYTDLDKIKKNHKPQFKFIQNKARQQQRIQQKSIKFKTTTKSTSEQQQHFIIRWVAKKLKIKIANNSLKRWLARVIVTWWMQLAHTWMKTWITNAWCLINVLWKLF